MGGHPSQAPERGDQAGGVGVVRLDRAIAPKVSVLAAPIARAGALAWSAIASAALLVGDRDVRSEEAACAQRATRLLEQSSSGSGSA